MGGPLSRYRLGRARNLRYVRNHFRGASRPAPSADGLRLLRLPAAEGFSAYRLRRTALRRGAEARRVSARRTGAGVPRFRLHEPIGRRPSYHARREGGEGKTLMEEVLDDRRMTLNWGPQHP